MLLEQINEVDSKERLADFVAALAKDLQENARDWENVNLSRFLDAMEAWVRDMDGYYKNTGQPIPDTPTWRTFATNADIGGVAGEEAGAIEGAEGAFAAEEASLLANAATATGSGVPNSLSGLANPNSIRFTQSSISSTFSDGSSLQEAIGALQSGVLSPSDLPPIRVYEKDGLIYTLDNRRLFVTSQAGTMVNITPATPQQVTSQAWKFTTPNQGCIICIRGVPKE